MCSFSKVVFYVGYRLPNDSVQALPPTPKKSLLQIQTFIQTAKYFYVFSVNYFVMRKGAEILHLTNVGKGHLGID